MAILGRVLEVGGFRVGIVAQPDWQSCADWRRFGRPRLFYAISAGNMDSMINHYTANRKVRNDDAYSPGGKIGRCARIARRSRTASGRGSVQGRARSSRAASRPRSGASATTTTGATRSAARSLLDCKADLLVLRHGGGRHPRDRSGGWTLVRACRRASGTCAASPMRSARRRLHRPTRSSCRASRIHPAKDKERFRRSDERVRSTTRRTRSTPADHSSSGTIAGPSCATRHRYPSLRRRWIDIYGLPYTRRPHPSYKEPIPAYTMIKDSVTIMRGCFGGCTFCSITDPSRSHYSIAE